MPSELEEFEIARIEAAFASVLLTDAEAKKRLEAAAEEVRKAETVEAAARVFARVGVAAARSMGWRA